MAFLPPLEMVTDYFKRATSVADIIRFDKFVTDTVDIRAPGQYAWLQQVYPDYLTRHVYFNPFFFHVSNVVRAPRELIKYLIGLLLSLPREIRRQWGNGVPTPIPIEQIYR